MLAVSKYSILKWFLVPRTITEVTLLAGVDRFSVGNNIANAKKHDGVVVESIGLGMNKHFYVSREELAKCKRPINSRVYDLMLGEYFTIKEIGEILELTSLQVYAAITYLRRHRKANIKVKKITGEVSQYTIIGED